MSTVACFTAFEVACAWLYFAKVASTKFKHDCLDEFDILEGRSAWLCVCVCARARTITSLFMNANKISVIYSQFILFLSFYHPSISINVHRMWSPTECYVLFQYIQGCGMTETLWSRRLTAEPRVQSRVGSSIRAARIQPSQISSEKFNTWYNSPFRTAHWCFTQILF